MTRTRLVPVSPATIRQLHRAAAARSVNDAAAWLPRPGRLRRGIAALLRRWSALAALGR